MNKTQDPKIMKANYLPAPLPALNPSLVTIAAWDSRSPAISLMETKRTEVCRVGFAFLLAAMLGACVTTDLRAQVVVVPNAQATNDGNTSATTPTGPASVRYMQIHDASQFGALAGPSFLTQFAWRPDQTPGPSGPRIVTLQVYASTTNRSVEELSLTFAENVGTNNTLVFDGALTWTTENLPGPGNTRQFDIVFPLTTPFLYDPAAGNLLLEFQQSADGSSITFDRVSNDPATKQVDAPGSTTASTAQFFGDSQVTQFTFVPEPSCLSLLTLAAIGLANRRRGKSNTRNKTNCVFGWTPRTSRVSGDTIGLSSLRRATQS